MDNCGGCTGNENVKFCHDHTTRLEQDLNDTANVIADLRVTMARMDKGADSIGSGGPAGSKPPINLDALDRYEQIREVLTGWATQLEGRAYLLLVRTEDVAAYLLSRVELIRRQDWAHDLLDELAEAMTAARMVTDRAADKISLGLCGADLDGASCTDTVTAITGAAIGRCRTCGTTRDVRAHQTERIAQAWHVQAPLPAILRALKQSGHLNIPVKRAEHWVQRGKLHPVAGSLFTPAAVMEAYRDTPTGRKTIPALSPTNA